MNYNYDYNHGYNYNHAPANDVLVIERDSDYEFNNFDYLTYLAIGFIYVFLLSVLIDRILNYERVEKICSTQNMQIGSEQYNEQIDDCKKAINAHNSKKFMYMIIVGVASILGGGYLARYDDRFMTGGLGIALGGLMAVIYFTISNWNTINRDFQIVLLGLT